MSTGKRATDQCKSKIKRLKEDYKNVKDSNKKSGVAPVLFTLSPIWLIISKTKRKEKDWVMKARKTGGREKGN